MVRPVTVFVHCQSVPPSTPSDKCFLQPRKTEGKKEAKDLFLSRRTKHSLSMAITPRLVRPHCSCWQKLGMTVASVTDSSTDTVANRSSTWLRLIALFGLGLVKPSTFTEAHEQEPESESSGRIFLIPRRSMINYCVQPPLLRFNADCFLLTAILTPAGHSGVGLGRLVSGIVGSNPAQSMDVCPHLSVLCCPV
jgi:hypothetical protein